MEELISNANIQKGFKAQVSDKVQLLRKGEEAAKRSTTVMIVLSFVKGIIGFASGSVALLADAIHSFSDIFASVAVWVGLRLAQKKPSERFPYGLYKVETLALLVVSAIIIVSGIETSLESMRRLWTSYTITLPYITIAVSSISVLASLLLSRYKSKVGESIGSQALMGEGKHSMVDAYSSLIVILGVTFNFIGIAWAEAVAGLIVSVIVLKLGLWMGKDSILILLDVCLKSEYIQTIREIAENIPGVGAVHAIKVRRAGPFVFGEMHVEVDESLEVERAHEISEKIEDKVKEKIKEMDSLTIHIEPLRKKKHRLAIPIAINNGLESRVHSHFGAAPYYIIVDVKDGEVIKWWVIENPSVKLEKRRGIETAHLLLNDGVDTLVTMEIGDGPFHILKDSGVKIYRPSPNMEVKEAIRSFLEGRMKPMETPSKSKGHIHSP